MRRTKRKRFRAEARVAAGAAYIGPISCGRWTSPVTVWRAGEIPHAEPDGKVHAERHGSKWTLPYQDPRGADAGEKWRKTGISGSDSGDTGRKFHQSGGGQWAYAHGWRYGILHQPARCMKLHRHPMRITPTGPRLTDELGRCPPESAYRISPLLRHSPSIRTTRVL